MRFYRLRQKSRYIKTRNRNPFKTLANLFRTVANLFENTIK